MTLPESLEVGVVVDLELYVEAALRVWHDVIPLVARQVSTKFHLHGKKKHALLGSFQVIDDPSFTWP